MKQAFVVLGFSLAAGSASAAIPDANGVIHGCYNVFTGSTRIIDGTNCGLLDRPVSWSQKGPAGASVTGRSLNVGDPDCPTGGVALTLSGTTSYVCNGPQGPQGPRGPQGPEGPAGDSDIFIGTGVLNVEPPLLGSTTALIEDRPFTAEADGSCLLTISGTQLDGMKGLAFRAVTRQEDGHTFFWAQEALMSYYLNGEYSDGAGGSRTNYPLVTGTLTDVFEIEAGHTYRVGLNIGAFEPNTPMSHARPARFRLSWICQYGLVD